MSRFEYGIGKQDIALMFSQGIMMTGLDAVILIAIIWFPLGIVEKLLLIELAILVKMRVNTNQSNFARNLKQVRM